MMLDESHVTVIEKWIILNQQILSRVDEEKITEAGNEIELEVQ